jgi:hypothetical protein
VSQLAIEVDFPIPIGHGDVIQFRGELFRNLHDPILLTSRLGFPFNACSTWHRFGEQLLQRRQPYAPRKDPTPRRHDPCRSAIYQQWYFVQRPSKTLRYLSAR